MKTILLTGGSSGIGLEIAKSLSQDPQHRLILPVRSAERARQLEDALHASGAVGELDLAVCDLSSMASVWAFAQAVAEKYPRIDVLLNNAGVWEMEPKFTVDGIEMNFAVNHLSPFLLTYTLLEKMKESAPSRIILTSSMAHRRNVWNPDDFEFRQMPYDGILSYSQSKLCNLLMGLQLKELLAGTGVDVFVVHPGYVQTDLFKNMGARDWSKVAGAEEGARSALYAALAPELASQSGKFIYHEGEDTATDMANDKEKAQLLWEISLQYCAEYVS